MNYFHLGPDNREIIRTDILTSMLIHCTTMQHGIQSWPKVYLKLYLSLKSKSIYYTLLYVVLVV